ncbi:MAG: hypothetical protein ABII00_00285 [Elusimicrobiota bacterium]
MKRTLLAFLLGLSAVFYPPRLRADEEQPAELSRRGEELLNAGKDKEAEPLIRRAKEIREKSLDPRQPKGDEPPPPHKFCMPRFGPEAFPLRHMPAKGMAP